VDVVECDLARGSLYVADEVFLTGTAAEITPVREIDRRPVGDGEPGPVTLRVQEAFAAAVAGKTEELRHWLTFV
jgi:branched-chain amino acid aminotransferase